MRDSRPRVRALAGALLALALWAGPAAAERIERMAVTIDVEPDAGLVVREEIAYDFGDARRHGIYRDVPVRYARRGRPDHRIVLEVLSVEDALGRPRRFRTERRGPDLRIRIGDPSREVTGRAVYRITYRARLAMLYFDAHDELYWNATGDEWEVPIDEATVRVRVAGRGSFVDAACFTGARGATGSACTAEAVGNEARFAAARPLGPRHGLTIVAALPKGVVRKPTGGEQLRARLAPFVSLWWLFPLATFGGMYGYWRRAGRDRGTGAAIPVRYEPPDGLTPAEVGTLVDERADLDDITASILQLAVEGYLEITQVESTSFLFFKRVDYRLDEKRDARNLKRHQSTLQQALFRGRDSVLASELKNEFYKELPRIKEALYSELSGRGGCFVGSPDQVRLRWAIAGGALTFSALVALAASPVAALCVALAGVIVLGFSRNMPRRTRRGRRAYEEILGFREFLERVDRDRLERQGTATREQFERILPYAIVLGAADAWADAFAGIYTEPPDWYHGYGGTDGFHPGLFVSDMGRGLDTIGHSLASQPGSGSGSSGFGGGGFSGVGFGGGGGGSW